MADDGLYRNQQVARRVRFRYEGSRARGERCGEQLRGSVLTEHENIGIGEFAPDTPSNFQAVQPRHGHIDHNELRFQLLGLFHAIQAICRLAADFPLRAGLQERAETAPEYLVIVSY